VFEPRLRKFNLVMAAGPKQRDRMVGRRLGQARELRHGRLSQVRHHRRPAQLADAGVPDDKPIVLYNPHFHPTLGSWPRWGVKVLEQFAADDRFNLIFAPHIKLFDGAGPAMLEALAPFRDHPRIHIDLGGPAAIDMTYTRAPTSIWATSAARSTSSCARPSRACSSIPPTSPGDGDESFHHWLYGPVLSASIVWSTRSRLRASDTAPISRPRRPASPRVSTCKTPPPRSRRPRHRRTRAGQGPPNRMSAERPVLTRVLANAGTLLGGRSINAVVSLGYIALTARGLGKAQMGVIVLITTFAQFLGEVVKFQSWQTVLQYGAPPLLPATGRVSSRSCASLFLLT
jgi:hypothetical protein